MLSCSGWTQRDSRRDGSSRFDRSYRQLPEWFPVEAVVRAAAREPPEVTATTDSYDEGPPPGTEELRHLVAHVLRLAARS